MKAIKRLLKRKGVIEAFFVSVAIVVIAGTGVLDTGDGLVEDLLFQSEEVVDDTIVVIGVDDKALEQFGAWPWDRSILAEAIEILNEDVKNRPAAIGLDVIFAGESNPESDQALAKAGKAGNVVVACSATFKDVMEREQNGATYINEFNVSSILEPYEALKNEVSVGHINAMYDKDGVLRRHLWKINDGSENGIESFPYEMYKLYNSYRNQISSFYPKQDERGFWYVDFASKPGDLMVYSIADILNRDFDPLLLQGSAIFIGPYDPGLSDDFVTAADRSERMYGVEYMANVLRAMVNEKTPVEVPDNVQLYIVFCMTFLIALMFYEVEPRRGLLRLIILVAGVFYGSSFFYRQGFIIHPLWIFGGVTFGFATSIVGHYYSANSEKAYIKNTFARYVDPEVINELLKEGTDSLNLGGRTVDITVMFVDICGFTTISEQFPATVVVEILNEYLTFVNDHIKMNGGTLDKYIGDCAMAFWGAPIECEDSAFKACKAAYDMVNNSDILRKSIMEKYEVDLNFGVGIHCGMAVVGNIGTVTRMDYTAIGDTVNTASRLQNIAQKGEICISREVADALGERGSYTVFDEKQKLKGKEEYKEVLLLDKLEY